MKTKVKKAGQSSFCAGDKPLRYAIHFVVFGATILGGAFFAPWVAALNVFFLLFIITRKKAVVLDLNSVFLSCLFLAAVLSTLIIGNDTGSAITELLRYSLFPLSYIVFLNIEDKEMVETAFYRSFILLAVAGLMAMAGLPLIEDMVIEESRRLQSFLQYANTTAMLLSAGVLMSVNYFTKTRNKLDILYGAVMLAALILTQSRIGIAVFIAVVALYVFVHIKTKTKYYAAAALAAIFAGVFVVAYRPITDIILGPTLVERLLTFTDASSQLSTNIFGIGMGQWQFTHFQFQTAPYQVRYIHSVYFQIALDCGFLGLIAFLAAAVNSFVAGARGKSIYVFILLLIAAGSALEVNFAFGIVTVFFTFVMSNLSAEHSGKHKVFNMKMAVRAPLVAPVLALALLLFSEAAFFVGRAQPGNPERARSAYQTALAVNPWNYRILMDMAKIEPTPRAALALLEQGHDANPLDRDFVRELALGYSHLNDYQNALKYARLLFDLHTYSKETQRLYETTLRGAYESGAMAFEEYTETLDAFRAEVEYANANINPLYRHADPDMEYRR